jgi:hypothetical protein
VRTNVIEAFSDAITYAMWIAVPVLFVAVVVFCTVPRIPLRDRHETEAPSLVPE